MSPNQSVQRDILERTETGLNGTTGLVSSIQRFSIGDGPGIRTTVFLQGCPLRCAWCHNPETIPASPALLFFENLCAGCRECAKRCPARAHTFDGGRHIFQRTLCTACGARRNRPAGALNAGRLMTVGEVRSRFKRQGIL